MSQLVFQSTSGGSITFLGATTSNAYIVNVPAANGTLVYTDGSGVTALSSLTVSGASTFNGTTSLAGFTSSSDGIFTGTGEVQLPAGTTGERSGTPTQGMIRYNTSYGQFEGYNGSAWGIVGGGATGSNGDQIFVLNGQTVTANYTIPSGKNASTAGKVTINTGIVVTVSTGSRWVIV